MEKDRFFFGKNVIGVNDYIIRRPIEEYSKILISIFGPYSISMTQIISSSAATITRLEEDQVIYFSEPAFFYRTVGSVHIPDNNEIQEMIKLFECFAEYARKVERSVPFARDYGI